MRSPQSGSIRLAEKLGMTREGDLRAHVAIKGEWCGATYFGLLAGEWTGASASGRAAERGG